MDSSTIASPVVLELHLDSTRHIPPELLSLIFNFCTTQPPPSRASKSDLPIDPWHWPMITHVCARWRVIALATPSLWQQVDLAAALPWTEAAVLRAPAAGPLQIACSRPFRLMGDRIPLVRGLMSRVRTLHICDNLHADVSLCFAAALGVPAPLLEHASLRARVFAELPRELFGGHAPLLRSLVLDEIKLSEEMDTCILSGLVSLSIGCDLYEDISVPLRFLRSSPALEDLTLRACCLEMSSEPTPDALVHLPHLSRLSLDGDMSSVAHTLAHLRIPSTTAITVSSTTSDWDAIDHILREVRAHLVRTDVALPFLSVALGICDARAAIRVRASRCEDPGMRTEALVDFDFKVQYGMGDHSGMLGALVAAMHYALDGPCYLDIAVDDDAVGVWDHPVWRGLLHTDFAGRVEMIRAPVRAARELCEALRVSRDAEPAWFACRQLTALRLVVDDTEGIDRDGEVERLVGAVSACVKERGDEGLPVRVEVEGGTWEHLEREMQVVIPGMIVLRKAI
ncbi:hypothetical protein FA95DRAFT_622818 [Auriscalpium vulgare]|uniref:Uncharacterized protein n=1 Tax=Auriscalpium vulgare TaxID=40419 RepID=A0ACB8S3E3_9AGAM|nr:hypothetical protein FA95DRAFT_622818 [Auriscalpium vulgare]